MLQPSRDAISPALNLEAKMSPRKLRSPDNNASMVLANVLSSLSKRDPRGWRDATWFT